MYSKLYKFIQLNAFAFVSKVLCLNSHEYDVRFKKHRNFIKKTYLHGKIMCQAFDAVIFRVWMKLYKFIQLNGFVFICKVLCLSSHESDVRFKTHRNFITHLPSRQNCTSGLRCCNLQGVDEIV